MTTLPNMSIVLPTLGGDRGTWDDKLNAALMLIDPHDHTSGKGVQVPTAGININADLTFAGFGAINLGRVAFTAVTALSSGSKALFVSSSDNELYWRTNAGANVKLTSGASLNTSLIGGIAGDYASAGAEVAYDDSEDRYTFKQQGSPKPWARVASGPVRIHEFGTTESVYVELAAPGALGASYTVTLPTAAPGSTSILQMDSSGVVSASNTVANAVSLGSTLGVTGLITATAGLTAAANQHVTVSGTGEIKHGDRVIAIGAAAFQRYGASAFAVPSDFWSFAAPPNDTIQAYVPLRQGDRVKSITWHFNKGSSSSALVMSLRTRNGTTDAAVDSLSDVTNGAAFTSVTRSAINYTVASGDVLLLRAQAGNTAHQFSHALVTYDRP